MKKQGYFCAFGLGCGLASSSEGSRGFCTASGSGFASGFGASGFSCPLGASGAFFGSSFFLLFQKNSYIANSTRMPIIHRHSCVGIS